MKTRHIISFCFLWTCLPGLFGQEARLGAGGDFDPANPGDPQVPVLKHSIGLAASPADGGTFNISSDLRIAEGDSVHLYAYPRTGFVFRGWMLGDSLLSKSSPYYYKMKTEDARLTALFEYAPENPANPGRNFYDAATGEVIVDDFTPGNLSSAIYEATLGHESEEGDHVTQITVSGKIDSYDFGIANNYPACTLVDLSRTYGYNCIPSYCYYGNTNLVSIILPPGLETIEYGAFYDCTSLTDISCYALVPPALEEEAFTGIAEGAVLHVPAAAIPLYAEAEGWKDFTILPLQEEVRSLEVSLPADAADGRYKDMTLELVNAETGQRQRYVISDRVVYTFNSLMKNSTFHLYVKNQSGTELGRLENVAIEEENVKVAFAELLQPQDVSLSVLLPDGTDITGQTTVTWLGEGSNFLKQGAALSGQTAGTFLTYRIVLPQTLAMEFAEPSAASYTVTEGDNRIVCTLDSLAKQTVTGLVKDITTGQPIGGAAVSISQVLNGKYSKSFTAKTGTDGRFSQQVFGAPTSIAVSAADYVSLAIDSAAMDSTGSVGELALRAITGVTITTSLTYTGSVAEGDTAETSGWYEDYANVAYTIYNVTQGKPITDFSAQYPQIVLLEEVAPGDRLRLTASSKTGAFVPVEAETVVDSTNRASATFHIVALGGIRASFTSTDNAAVAGILYDANGQLVKKYNYTDAQLSISSLADGQYLLVTMASSSLFNSILNLSEFAASGLTEGADYVVDSVTVRSGVISLVANEQVPALDESKLYYTGESTMFTVNKSSIVAGNYLTLKGRIDFKDEYAAQVGNVSMVVDLPESCSFVENSVMVGTRISGYTIDGQRLTIPLDNYRDEVRFCVIPTAEGSYAPSAFAHFTLDGSEVQQPIGSANYEVKDLSIIVPSTVAKTTIPVSGTAIGKSTIQIYDNGVLIGQTTALANGIWNTTCELYDSIPMQNHLIYAAIKTPQGIDMESETCQCLYNPNAVEPNTVTMTFYNGWLGENVDVVFDFQQGKVSKSSYMFYTTTDITFLADLTKNDTTIVPNVYINVYTDHDEIRQLKAEYDTKTNKWVAISNFGSNNLPINVSVSIDDMCYNIADTLSYQLVMDELIGNIVPTVESNNEDSTLTTLNTEDGRYIADVIDKEVEGTKEEVAKELQDLGYTQQIETDSVIVLDNDTSLIFVSTNPPAFVAPTHVTIIRIVRKENQKSEILNVTNRLTNKWTNKVYSKIDCNAGLKEEGFEDVAKYIDTYSLKMTYSLIAQTIYTKKSGNIILEHNSKKELVGNVIRYRDSTAVRLERCMRIVKTPYDCSFPGNPPLPPLPSVPPIHDPSGYVYEAVSSNRLEGVTATCYYKETVEDMYGDLHENVVLWDAAEYAQENPLFTDENGMYRWDVPQGLWQVKFEKEGYQTTYSDWLPVPPPQLEVNIAMTQSRQPEVQTARAYEDGIEVEFDKYMLPETMTTDNLFASVGGEKVEGSIALLNEEKAYEGEGASYVSKVRFIPSTPFLATDEVTLTVSRQVKSYAGIQMESDYTQAFDIEKEVKSLAVDSVMRVPYTGQQTITVSALPYDAAIGKQVVVKSSSPMIVSLSADTLTLDESGQARLTLNGELPGMAAVTFALQGTGVEARSNVQVLTEESLYTPAPIASRASGTAVYRNTEIELSCAASDAVIYYTTDGSCPCIDSTRLVYEGPIAITGDVTIKAIAVATGLYESEVAEFSYTIKQTTLGLDLNEGWNWISHNLESPVATAVIGENAVRIVGQTEELVDDPAYGLTGNLSELNPTQAYKIQVSAATRHTLNGYEYNPATPFEVKTGWNWIGYPVSQTLSVAEAFASSIPDEEEYIVGQAGFAQYADGQWTGTLQTLVPGSGYLYFSKSDKQLAYNSAIVSRAQALHAPGLPTPAPWAVNRYRYPNVMCLVADVFVEGAKASAGDYSVGAFCGTECRGIGTYVDGKLMMNIYGEGGEEISFVAVDNATETTYAIRESEPFAETLLGSIRMPYSLTIGGDGTTGLDNRAGNAWKVWLAEDGSRLFLASGSGKAVQVSITDMGGNTVLTAGDAAAGSFIDVAHLPEGVYIVTLFDGTDWYYQKIVKSN